MVGYRNLGTSATVRTSDVIRRSDGGVSEQDVKALDVGYGCYQAFRWWGIGTDGHSQYGHSMMLSGVPMVGYRNGETAILVIKWDVIRRSDGGVSEPALAAGPALYRCYQAFRWWGIGTRLAARSRVQLMLSGVPMVGYRNAGAVIALLTVDVIRRSDGGVSEPSWSSTASTN